MHQTGSFQSHVPRIYVGTPKLRVQGRENTIKYIFAIPGKCLWVDHDANKRPATGYDYTVMLPMCQKSSKESSRRKGSFQSKQTIKTVAIHTHRQYTRTRTQHTCTHTRIHHASLARNALITSLTQVQVNPAAASMAQHTPHTKIPAQSPKRCNLRI